MDGVHTNSSEQTQLRAGSLLGDITNRNRNLIKDIGNTSVVQHLEAFFQDSVDNVAVIVDAVDSPRLTS